MPRDFPLNEQVVPQIVTYKSPDGLEIHAQLFLPPNITRWRAAADVIFVHGGPQRQMLPGYHYMQFYHWAYAVNQWFANQGYVVMSINYRSGIGYGRDVPHRAQHLLPRQLRVPGHHRGCEVPAGRADVDPKRLGIWGLSYGGLLTSQALARNSDIFVAGADLAGVHLSGSSLDTTSVSFQSSTISQIDKWKSPVFLGRATTIAMSTSPR